MMLLYKYRNIMTPFLITIAIICLLNIPQAVTKKEDIANSIMKLPAGSHVVDATQGEWSDKEGTVVFRIEGVTESRRKEFMRNILIANGAKTEFKIYNYVVYARKSDMLYFYIEYDRYSNTFTFNSIYDK